MTSWAAIADDEQLQRPIVCATHEDAEKHAQVQVDLQREPHLESLQHSYRQMTGETMFLCLDVGRLQQDLQLTGVSGRLQMGS